MPIPLTPAQQARVDEREQRQAEREQTKAVQASQRQAIRDAREQRRLTPTEQTLAAEARLETERMQESRKAVYYTMGNSYFEQFVERRMPPELRDGAAVPPTWVGTTVEWNSLRQQAEDVAREKLAAEFAEGIALRGMTPEEMATGELVHGSEVYAVTGKVKRPPQPAIPEELEDAARQLMAGLAARRITLDSIQQVKLERVAGRRWQGELGPVEIVLQQAKTAIEAHDARQQSARQEADALPTLTVLWPFHGPGRDFAPGEEKITPEFAERLTEWAQTIEAQAKGRTLSSMGFPQWPVFSLTNGSSA